MYEYVRRSSEWSSSESRVIGGEEKKINAAAAEKEGKKSIQSHK